MNPASIGTLDQLTVDEQNAYINYVVDNPQKSVRKVDSYFLRRLHTLALEKGFDALTAADVEETHSQFYAGLKNGAIHSYAMQALARFNNVHVIDAAIKIVVSFKEASRGGSCCFQFAGTSLATLALKIGARPDVIMAICKHLSAAQHASVLGSCVGDQTVVDRFDGLMPGVKMGQEGLRQAISADGKVRTGPEWTNTHWIDMVTDRINETKRVIGKPVLESIVGTEIDRGLFDIKQPVGAAALAAPTGVPRDIAHLLYVLVCTRGWRFPHDADFYEQLKNSNGQFHNRLTLFGWRSSLKSCVLGRALKTACDAALKAAKPKAHGVTLAPTTLKRLGIVA